MEEYLNARMIDFLQENDFGYIKIDYNDTYGMGCDGAESLGEGGRQVAECSLGWLSKLRRALPDLVIENCSSGGSRIEPKRMSMVSMCSFSDAHECAEIPFVAANVTRVIPAQQAQIWAVLRQNDTPSRTVYSLTAAMLGRVCLSGDVLNMPPDKVRLLQEGLDFYRAVKDIVRDGDIVDIDCDIEYYRAPLGRQIYKKALGEKLLVFVHALNAQAEICVPLQGYRLERAYTQEPYAFEGETLRLLPRGTQPQGTPFHAGVYPDEGAEQLYRAGAFLLQKEAAHH